MTEKRSETTRAGGAVEEIVVPRVAQWMALEAVKNRKASDRRIAKETRSALSAAQEIFKQAQATGSIQCYWKRQRLIAVLMVMKKSSPRVRGERVIFFEYDPLYRRSALSWLRRLMRAQGSTLPPNSWIGVQAKDEMALDKVFRNAGYWIKYQTLEGSTRRALTELTKRRGPSRNLAQLGLKIRKIVSSKEVDRVIALQRSVFAKSREHGFFGHTQLSLKRDRLSYLEVMQGGNGILLGIYQKDRLVGVAAAVYKGGGNFKKTTAGISIFFDRSIQGLGISKTCYSHLLEFLKSKGIPTFRGGTSQSAIKHLGEVMKRRHRYTIFLKPRFKR